MTTMRTSLVSSHVQDLIDAASGHQRNTLHELYLSYPDPNIIDEEGQHALIHASRMGHTCVVKILCEQGSNLDLKDLSGTTALIYAVRYGHEKVVKHLCRRNANLNACDNKGRTALHYAALRGFQRIARMLLRWEAEVDLQDNTGRSALHIAVARDNATVVEVLLKKGASLTLKDGEKVTARQCAEKRRCSLVQEAMDKYQTEKFSDKNRLGSFFTSKLLGLFSTSKNIISKDVDTELRHVHCVIENDYFQPRRNREEMTAREEVAGIGIELFKEQGPRGTDVSLTSPHLDDFSLHGATDNRTINSTDLSNREPCKNDPVLTNRKPCDTDFSPERSPQPQLGQQTLTRRECEKLAGYETCSFFIPTQKLLDKDPLLTPVSTRCNEPVFYPITPTAHQGENARVTLLQLQSFNPTMTSTPVQNKRLDLDNKMNNNNFHTTPLLTPGTAAKVLVNPSTVSTTHRNMSQFTGVSSVEQPESTAGALSTNLQRNEDVYFTPPPLPPKQSKKRGNLDAIFAVSQLPHSQREDLNPPFPVMNSTSTNSLTIRQILPQETGMAPRYQLHSGQNQMLNFISNQDCEESYEDVVDETHCSQTPMYAKAEILLASLSPSDNSVFRTSRSLHSKSSPGSNADNACSFSADTLPLPKKRAARPGCPQITRLNPSKRRARLDRMKDISQNYQKDQEINNQNYTLSQSPNPLDEIINHQQQKIELCKNPTKLQLFQDKSQGQSDPVVALPRLPRRKPDLLVNVPHTNSIGLSSTSPQNTPKMINKPQSPRLTRMCNTNMHATERSEQESSHNGQTRPPGQEYDQHAKFGEASVVGQRQNNGRRTYNTQLSDSDEYLIQNLKAPQGRDDKTSTFPRNSLAGGSSLSSQSSRDTWISSGEKNLAPEHGVSGDNGILSQDALNHDALNKEKKAIYQHMKRAISEIDLSQNFSTIKTSRSCPSITQPTEFGAVKISLKVFVNHQLHVNCQELQVAKADFLATNDSQLQVFYNRDDNHRDDNHRDENGNEEFG